MRCQQCGHTNPEDHKFCGMCGARLEPLTSAVNIDDNDPLDIEAPAYSFEDRSRASAPVAEFTDRDRQRERTREASRNRPAQNGVRAVVSVKSFPPDTVQEEAAEEGQGREPRRASGIGGPSFLGLSYEGSNSGFVYDKPRNDGFVYDSDGQGSEYLLEDAPRRSSWRAWLLFFLLAAGAGLGYIQWRASHNEGPDLGAILAGNGATVDPNHPVVNPDAAKPAQKPNPPAASNPSDDSNDDSNKDGAAKSDSESNQNSDAATAKASADDNTSDDAKAANPKSGDTNEKDSDTASDTSAKSKTAASKSSDEDASPENDGPAKVAARSVAKPAAVAEKPPQPKSLGDKDPLIIQAEKYIQGRGVRQNCSTGVNLLRQAMSAGNPEADVKMGALYWSGTCVTQSNVTAYEWFSRAHSLQPQNRWIERSRNSLWASMSPQEKRQVGY